MTAMSRIGVVAILLAVFAGCASSPGLFTSDAGRDSAPPGTDAGPSNPAVGTPYTCPGGPFPGADGGELQVTCVVGRTYCYAYEPESLVPHPDMPTCLPVPSECVETPTCGCIQATNLCTCQDTGASVIVTCQMI